MQLAHFSQPKTRGTSSTRAAPPTIETRKEMQDRSAFSRNEPKNETILSLSGVTRQ